MIGIYKITNKVNNKIYIGESMDIDERWGKHKIDLQSNCHHSWKLQNDWNKYGEENFTFSNERTFDWVKDVITCKSFLIILESMYIEKYNSLKDGYNIENTYQLVKDRQKHLFDNKVIKSEYLIFDSVDKIISIKNKFKDTDFNKDGFISAKKFFMVGFDVSKNDNRKIVISLSSKLGIKNCVYSKAGGGTIVNKHMAKFISIINGNVYVHKSYMDEIINYWIGTHIGSINIKDKSMGEADTIDEDVYSNEISSIINKLKEYDFSNEITLTKLLDTVGLSRTIYNKIKKDLSIDSKKICNYKNGIYTKPVCYEIEDKSYIGVFASTESIEYIVDIIKFIGNERSVSRKIRDMYK